MKTLFFILIVTIVAVILVASNSVVMLPVIGMLFGSLGIMYIISYIYRN